MTKRILERKIKKNINLLKKNVKINISKLSWVWNVLKDSYIVEIGDKWFYIVIENGCEACWKCHLDCKSLVFILSIWNATDAQLTPATFKIVLVINAHTDGKTQVKSYRWLA